MKAHQLIKKFGFTLVILIILSFGVPGYVKSAKAATGTICDQYGSTTQGNYIVMNNRWGTTATQCINVTTSGFQIIQQDGTGNLGGAPVSYPAIYVGCHYSNCSPSTNLPMQLSAISAANTTVSLTYPATGTYDASYDIWLNDTTNVSGVQKTEIMIWLNYTGAIQPIGSNTGTITLAGNTWAVWVGNNGQNNVVSYVKTGLTSFNTDVKPFLLDAITRGSGFGTTAWYLTSMQMGFEPWINGVGLTVNSFSANITTGGSGPTPTRTNTPVATATRTNTPIGPTPTRTNTPVGPTATRTNTPVGPTATFTRTPTASAGACSPVSATITAPFTYDGGGSFCWKSSNLGTYINSWNTTSVSINGVSATNLYLAAASYPAQISGFWYVSYNSSATYGHFESK